MACQSVCSFASEEARETEKKLDPNKWPYKLLQNMPDFQERGELTEELKKKVDPKPFYRLLCQS